MFPPQLSDESGTEGSAAAAAAAAAAAVAHAPDPVFDPAPAPDTATTSVRPAGDSACSPVAAVPAVAAARPGGGVPTPLSPRSGRSPPPVELAVTPGKACGPFSLGSCIGRAIGHTQSREFRFVSNVEFKYSDERPFDIDMALHLPRIGLLLRFEPASQKLRCVQLYGFAAVRLIYRSHEFCSRKTLPTCLALYKLFGPTYPGEFDSRTNLYTLHYPGISFVFPIPDKYASLYKDSDCLPLEFPDGTTPVCTRIFIFDGDSRLRECVMPSPQLSLAAADGTCIVEEVVATVRKGVVFKLVSERPVSILLRATTTQDVITDLGAPGALFYKEDDRMSIHHHRRRRDDRRQPQGDHPIMAGAAPDEDDEKAVETCDYFLCYFNLGIDILFDGLRHVCKKLVLHTNLPGHVEFNLFAKCQFKLLVPDPVNENEEQPRCVTSEMKWEEILSELGPACGKPAVVERGSRNPDPFGPTILNGYDGVIFEVTKHGYQAAATLY